MTHACAELEVDRFPISWYVAVYVHFFGLFLDMHVDTCVRKQSELCFFRFRKT